MTAQIIRGNALHLPLADESVDLVCTSPPYFGLRSYQDDGEHYAGQLGSEATPAEYVDALIGATREMVRVLKPSGSIWVNLGDRYSSGGRGAYDLDPGRREVSTLRAQDGARPKSLLGIPWRYAIRCIDELGLILRAEVIWSKSNGLPESVQDRVRRSHEQWFHFTKEPRYYSAVDEIREAHNSDAGREGKGALGGQKSLRPVGPNSGVYNPLGKLPGSVWTIPTEPLKVPDHVGVDHFAAFPTEWPRRIIMGWSPRDVCTGCGEGRRPVTEHLGYTIKGGINNGTDPHTAHRHGQGAATLGMVGTRTVTDYVCACPDTTAPTTPGVCLDPFGGTGTTALVASVLGRHGVTVDMSADYCQLAEWRTTDPNQRAHAARVDKPAVQVDGQEALFEVGAG